MTKTESETLEFSDVKRHRVKKGSFLFFQSDRLERQREIKISNSIRIHSLVPKSLFLSYYENVKHVYFELPPRPGTLTLR